jgi:hypothetical protein
VLAVERHYGYPVDVEWVLDRHRREGEPVCVVQARPVTVTAPRPTPPPPIGTPPPWPPSTSSGADPRAPLVDDQIQASTCGRTRPFMIGGEIEPDLPGLSWVGQVAR